MEIEEIYVGMKVKIVSNNGKAPGNPIGATTTVKEIDSNGYPEIGVDLPNDCGYHDICWFEPGDLEAI
jgi:hypothetical protein